MFGLLDGAVEENRAVSSTGQALISNASLVILPLLKAPFVRLQRNLLYAAITRGKKKVFLVGEPAAYAMAVRNAESKTRCTHLREKIAATQSP